MVISGENWAQYVQDELILTLLWNKISQCEGVLFSKMSAPQKGQVAKWIRDNGKIVCGVGDAPNDIPML